VKIISAEVETQCHGIKDWKELGISTDIPVR
jgi:hypothetical protein